MTTGELLHHRITRGIMGPGTQGTHGDCRHRCTDTPYVTWYGVVSTSCVYRIRECLILAVFCLARASIMA